MSTFPNVLFVIADQHNAKVLGHRGHPDVQTPNLDRMAAEGVRFENAVTQNPICTPSRVSFLSGQYCHNHGYYGLSGPNPRGLPNLLGYFRRVGYRTSAVGKIHCPEYWVEDDSDNFHETCGCSIGGRSPAYTAFLRERGKAELEDHGALTEFGPRGRQSMEGRPSPLSFEESQEGWITAETIRFIDETVAQGAPFFAHVSFPRPHQCTSPSEPFWSMYNEASLHLPPNADYEMTHKAPHFKRAADHWRRGEWTLFEPRTFEAGRLRKLHGYFGAVSQVDHAVGLLLEHLRKRGLARNTIVVYTADHGDYAAEHGIMEKAPGICADAITRIPFLWHWPGRFAAGHVATELVEAIDLSSTLCALAGLPLLETSDGRDISHLLRGETGDVRSIAVTEFAWSKSVRKGRWRLVRYPREMFRDDYPEGFGELYDLEKDPWEMHNLYFDPAHRERVLDLERELTDWLITTTRPTTVLPAPVCAGPQVVTRYRNAVNRDNRIRSDRLRELRGRNYL
ncbi:MAG: sulfatase-like hydrolase/transferase [Kiritimatiellaeota bacterium]|nr:sulfatase-like hydrolase/transferase [Kiritimatiellota bacterium]